MAVSKAADATLTKEGGDDEELLSNSYKMPTSMALRNALFEVLHEMVRDTNVSFALLCGMWLLELLSLLMLPLGASPTLPWRESAVMNAVWSGLGPIWFAPGSGMYLPAVGHSWTTLYAVLAGWTAIVLLLAVWLTLAHTGVTDYRPKWMTVLLRFSARLAIHGLWTPIAINLASPFRCSSGLGADWFGTGVACWQGEHIAMVAGAALLLPCGLLWNCFVASTFINREPDYTGKRNLLAAPHGRVDVAMLLLKTVMAVFYVFASDTINSWGWFIACLVAGMAWMWIYITYLPYHHPSLNGLQVGASAVFMSASVCGLVAEGVGSGAGGGQSGAIAFLLFLPVTIYAGWAAMAARTRVLVTGKSASGHELDLNSPYAIDVRVRCLLVDAIALGHDPRTNHAGSDSANEDGPTDMDATSINMRGRKRHTAGFTSGDGSDSDIQAADVRNQCSNLWLHGSRAFGNSAMLHLFQAGYQAIVTRNAHLERLRLRDAVDRADWSQVDVHFFAWSRLRVISEMEDSDGASKMNVERRMRFEKLQATSRIAVALARANVLSFWSELSSKNPDLQKLKVLGLSINSSLVAAEVTFKELLELAPQNATLMRLYADFLLELANNPRKAQELLTDAEQIEEDASKAHAIAQAANISFMSVVTDFDLSADSVALIKVSCETGRVGAIMHVNGQACKMFGFSQREMMAKTLSELIPAPIGPVHNAMITRFLQTGVINIIGVPRVSFVLHRAGYMVPVKMNVRASAEGFAAVMDTMVTPPGEMYVWCFGEKSGWRVTAVCEAAMGLLGVDMIALKAGSLALTRYVADPATALEPALNGTHTTVDLINTAADSTGSHALVHKGSKGSMKALRDAVRSTITVSVQAQCVTYRQVGQTLYMLRLKKVADSAALTRALAEADRTAKDVDDATSGSSEDSDQDVGSDAVDQGSPLSEDRSPIKDNKRKDSAFRPGAPLARKATPPVQARPGLPPAHPVADGMDMDACPVMRMGRTGTPPAGTVSRVPSSGPGAMRLTRGSSGAQVTGPAASAGETVRRDSNNSFASAGSAQQQANPSSNPTSKPPSPMGESAAISAVGSQATSNPIPIWAAPTVAVPARKKKMTMRLPSDHEDSGDENDGKQYLPPEDRTPKPSAAAAAGAVPGGSDTAAPEGVTVDVAAVPTAGQSLRGPMPSPTDEAGLHSVLKKGKPAAVDDAKDDNKSAASGNGNGRKAGSVHSKGSKGSGTSATSVTEILRRGVNAKAGHLETSLRLTRWAVLLVFAITATLNITSLVVTRNLLNQLSENINLVFQNGRRAVLAQRLYANVQAWSMATGGLAELPNMALEKERNSLYIEQLETINLNLYSKVDGSLPEEKALYTDGAALVVKDLVPGQTNSLEVINFAYTNRTLNLANAVIEFVSRMRRILELNNTEIQYSNPDVFWIVDTGSNSLRIGMNNSLMYADKRSEFQGGLIKNSDMIILVVSEATFLVIMCCVMLPAVLQVIKAHHAVFQTFIQVPLPIIRAMRSSVQKRINAIVKAEEEADVGIDIGGAGNELEAEDADDGMKSLLAHERDKMRSRMKNPAAGAATDDDGDDDSSVGKNAVRTAVNATANSTVTTATKDKAEKKKKKARAYRRQGSDLVIIMLKFIWPIMLYMLYFAVMWWYKGTVVDQVTKARSELLWMTQAEVYMNLATIRSRFAAAACNPDYLASMLDSARNNGAFTEFLVDAVMYGNTERNMRSGLQTGMPAFVDLWTKEGCVDNNNWFYGMEDCAMFDAGITSKGLLGAFRSFADYSRQLVTQRRRAIGDPNCAPVRMNDQGSVAYLVNKFGSALLAVGFERASILNRDQPLSYLTSFDSMYTMVVALTCVALGGFWLLVYSPLIARLDKDIKNVRLLLLLFPDEVARSVPAIVAAGRQLLAEAGSSAGSVATGSLALKR